MPIASVHRRAPCTLIESGRVRSRNHQFAFASSIVAQVVLVCVATIGLSRVVLLDEAPLSDRPTFLAPLVQTQPRPIQEHVSYVALGGAASPEPQRAIGVTPERMVVTELAVAAPAGGGDSQPPAAARVEQTLPVFSEVEVDSAASRDPDSEAPVYPATLMAKGVQGSVLATFVVDTNGRPDVSTYIALESTHVLFGTAVRDALPRMKFRPAKRDNVPVRQQVELRFSFRVIKPPVTAPKPPEAPVS